MLLHKMSDGSDCPIGFTLRFLSNAEKCCMQIEKEGVSCTFGVKNFILTVMGILLL